MENGTQEKEEDIVEPTDDSAADEAPKKEKKKTWTSAEKVPVPDWMQSTMDAAREKRASDAAESKQEIEDEIARQKMAGIQKIATTPEGQTALAKQLSDAGDDPAALGRLGFEQKHQDLYKKVIDNLRREPGSGNLESRLEEKDYDFEGTVKLYVLRFYDQLHERDDEEQKDELRKSLEKLISPVAERRNIKASLLRVMKSKGVPLTNENLLKIKSILLESKNKNMFNIVNETERDMAETLGYLNEFLPFSKEKMNYDRPVKIRFVSDQANAGDVLGKTAHYNPSIDEIAVYVDERHPKDIMRSVSHELVHHSQNCRGEFDGATTLGEQPYMQTSEHLNEMERQAYEVGNMTFRTWEDNYKHTQRENKKMSINEKTVRAAVKEALMKRIKEVVVREPGDTSPLTPEEIKLFLAASGHTGAELEVAPPGFSGVDVEEVLPPGVTAADVAEMAPEEEEEGLEESAVDESTDEEWYRSTLNESLIKRFIK